MRVCHLCSTTLDSHYFANLGRGLRASGVTVIGATLFEPKPPPWLSATGGDYLSLDARYKWRYPGAVWRLASWLRDNLYSLGRKFTPKETIERLTGTPTIDPQPYLAYLREKLASQPAGV